MCRPTVPQQLSSLLPIIVSFRLYRTLVVSVPVSRPLSLSLSLPPTPIASRPQLFFCLSHTHNHTTVSRPLFLSHAYNHPRVSPLAPYLTPTLSRRPSSQHQRTATPPPVRPVSSSTSDKSYDTESCVSDKAGGGGSRQAPRPALSTNVLDNDAALASGESWVAAGVTVG